MGSFGRCPPGSRICLFIFLGGVCTGFSAAHGLTGSGRSSLVYFCMRVPCFVSVEFPGPIALCLTLSFYLVHTEHHFTPHSHIPPSPCPDRACPPRPWHFQPAAPPPLRPPVMPGLYYILRVKHSITRMMRRLCLDMAY